eukprot:gene5327-7097_t
MATALSSSSSSPKPTTPTQSLATGQQASQPASQQQPPPPPPLLPLPLLLRQSKWRQSAHRKSTPRTFAACRFIAVLRPTIGAATASAPADCNPTHTTNNKHLAYHTYYKHGHHAGQTHRSLMQQYLRGSKITGCQRRTVGRARAHRAVRGGAAPNLHGGMYA